MNEKNNKKEQKGRVPVELVGEGAGREEPPVEKGEAKEPESAEKKEQTPLEKLQAQLEEKTRNASEYFDKWLRLRAEFENFKKRMLKEKSEVMKFGNESLIKALLPTLDNLERAINHGKDLTQTAPLLEGVEIIYKHFLNTLERFGVKPFPAVGELFDPEKHEAISQEESDQEPNRVISEVLKGYLFHDRLLRPAKVIVSKTKGEQKTEEAK